MKLNILGFSLLLFGSFTQGTPLNYFQSLLSSSLSIEPQSIDLNDYNFTNDYDLSNKTLTELFTLHKFLVSIPSVSYHEYEISQRLGNYLKSKGLTVEYQEISKTRYNVFAYKGTNNETKVLVNSHIDTVPPFFPYSLSEDGTKIFGRGSTDAKGSVSAEIIAFLEIVDSLKEGEVSLLFDVGEENGADGIGYVEDNIDYKWNSLIVGEPTENKLGVGHKGGYGGSIKVTGKASHSGYPELGIDANAILIDFLHILKHKPFPEDKLLGKTTLNVGFLEGGVAANVVSPFAKASLGFRVATNVEETAALVQEALEEVEGGEYIEFTGRLGGNPLFFDYEVEGFESVVLGYGTDASKLLKNDIPHKFLYGPGSIHVAHGAGEFVETDSLVEAVDGYKRLIKHALSL